VVEEGGWREVSGRVVRRLGFVSLIDIVDGERELECSQSGVGYDARGDVKIGRGD
jgi:hypothetical protein